ncbi:MAG TPA: glycosyltransferase family 2 protein [Polyangiaceae bacterium]|nr:glycosyltransferase family 2 protein [Polyangiaceae bacterium]
MSVESERSELSVIVCTQNRAECAIACIETLLRQPHAEALDIIVVDNASRPQQREQLGAALASKPVRLFDEARAGVSYARNYGFSLARSNWVAYLDDDALPFPDWTERALELVARDEPHVGLIGGAVLPRWPKLANQAQVDPTRLGDRWLTLLSLIDSERRPHGSAVPEIVACNMLVRRNLLEEVGGFPTNLGRTPGSLLGGEEIAVARLVAERGFAVRFDPELRVYHQIHAERLGTDWVRRRAEAEGELLWKCAPSAATTAKVILSIPYLALASGLRGFRDRKPRNYDFHVRLWNNLGFLKSALSSVLQK